MKLNNVLKVAGIVYLAASVAAIGYVMPMYRKTMKALIDEDD